MPTLAGSRVERDLPIDALGVLFKSQAHRALVSSNLNNRHGWTVISEHAQ